MLVLDMGCLEEFGGWFTSLNIQYLGNDGHWYDVGKFKSTPALPETDIVFSNLRLHNMFWNFRQ